MDSKEIFSKKGKFIIFKYSPIDPISHNARDIIIDYMKQSNALEVVRVNIIRDEELNLKMGQVYGVENKSSKVLVIENQKCVAGFSEVTLEKLKSLV